MGRSREKTLSVSWPLTRHLPDDTANNKTSDQGTPQVFPLSPPYSVHHCLRSSLSIKSPCSSRPGDPQCSRRISLVQQPVQGTPRIHWTVQDYLPTVLDIPLLVAFSTYLLFQSWAETLFCKIVDTWLSTKITYKMRGC